MNHVLPAWDVACGLYAAIGLLAAERRRQRTGAGSVITLALADVAMAVAGHLGFLAEPRSPGPTGRGSGTTCTAAWPGISGRPTASGSWWWR